MPKLQYMELSCWNCNNGQPTLHEYQYSVQSYEQEKASEEQAWDEIASEGPIQDFLVNTIIRSPAGKAGKQAADLIGGVLESFDGVDEIRGKDVYKCTQCGNTVYV